MDLASTVDVVKAIAELAKAVAWPTAVLIIVWWFRRPLFELANRLKRLKYKDLDADFGEGLLEIRSEISKWIAPGKPPAGFLESAPTAADVKASSESATPRFPFTDSLPADLERQVVQAPLEAVVNSWNKVEGAVTMFVAVGAAAPSAFPSILRTLTEGKVIQESTRDVVIGLRHLRNLAVHSGEPISTPQARDFVTMAESITWVLGKDLRNAAKPKFPPSENLGRVEKDGHTYTLHFYGENEGAAVITTPIGQLTGSEMVETREVHREDAKDAVDARAKLTARLESGGLK